MRVMSDLERSVQQKRLDRNVKKVTSNFRAAAGCIRLPKSCADCPQMALRFARIA